jgi:putative ABC transport system permease protein
MNLSGLTLRNVQRNFRLYTIYLVSMIAGVIIHFTFSSLMFNQDILDMLKNRQNFQNGVMIASVVVFLFIIFFILYANSFFMRQRQKEFGLYLLLGLSERQITLMVFYETLMVSAVSLTAGILTGGLLSKLFGMLLMNLMQYDHAVQVSFSLKAIGSTVLLFFLLTLIISVQSHLSIRRVQLVELFHAKEKVEKPIRPSGLLALLAVVLLGEALILISRGIGSVLWREYNMISLVAAAVGIIGGTYLFYRQFAGWLLGVISRRRRYYEGNTLLWTSSLRFQVRSNASNLTFISLAGAAVILLTCFVTINYKVQFEAVGHNITNDIAFQTLDDGRNREIDRIIRSSGHEVEKHWQVEALKTQPVTKMDAAFDNPQYFMPEVLLVSQEAYNGTAGLRGHDDRMVSLKGNEALALSQGTDFAKSYESGKEASFIVRTPKETELLLVEKKDYALLGWSTVPGKSMDKKPAILVVADAFYEELRRESQTVSYELYQISNPGQGEALSSEIHRVVSQVPGTYYSAFADVYSAQIESSSLLLFAGGFLALISVFALASIIYFRQLRVATEEQQQYAILRKIGIGPGQMKSVIRKQLLFVFAPPLVLAAVHSWFIIKYYILDSVQDFPELVNAVWATMGIYLLVYLLFYLSSTNLYYRIISQKQ